MSLALLLELPIRICKSLVFKSSSAENVHLIWDISSYFDYVVRWTRVDVSDTDLVRCTSSHRNNQCFLLTTQTNLSAQSLKKLW